MKQHFSIVGGVLAFVLGGCFTAPTVATPTITPAQSPSSTPSITPDVSATPSPTVPTSTPSQSASKTAEVIPPELPPLDGKVIVIDPGHNGKYQKSFNTKKVPAGNGKKKNCNSSGTATNSGYAEHAYNWAQAKALRTELEKLGAKVLFTRENDSGLGPCVNIRAGVANDAKADLLISIHADGNLAKKARGFHVILSQAMAGGSKLEAKSKELAQNARDALQAATNMPRSTYIGKGTGLSLRSDIATLNLLKTTPGIMMEMGNMRNSADVKLLTSKNFRTEAAKALAQAAVETLT